PVDISDGRASEFLNDDVLGHVFLFSPLLTNSYLGARKERPYTRHVGAGLVPARIKDTSS
ncbi:MAG: hypothetical protein KAR32_11130, partial [Candidatus Omnitrophica bacterium]|nr:hypothetical protein [Candidatus Omnitrophota bacterium]